MHEAQQRKVQYYLEGLEVERKRLAKELHDNVSNELLAIKMKSPMEQVAVRRSWTRYKLCKRKYGAFRMT